MQNVSRSKGRRRIVIDKVCAGISVGNMAIINKVRIIEIILIIHIKIEH